MSMTLLKPEVKKLLNEAIENELYASRLYMNIANQLQAAGYFGGQKHFLAEAADELTHYQKLVDYVNDRGSVADVAMTAKQADKVSNLMEAFENSLQAETDLEKFYVDFYEKAEDEMEDCVTAQFLLQFIEIQRKAIGEVKDIISTLMIAKDNSAALLIIDAKLGA